ncbi:CoA-binding protein [bacterium]|nr:CoA-binding protein [bacterium]
MINQQLINPQSIAVIGAGNQLNKPGGRLLNNLLQGTFKGAIHVVNRRERQVQGIAACASVAELPQVDLAILAVPAVFCPPLVQELIDTKNTRAFIIISAGFSELTAQGAALENQLKEMVEAAGACLIGPNCIGIINKYYQGVFTTPVPTIDVRGVDLISSSGATAVFLMEAAIPRGMRFSNVFSVGNSAQIGVEEVLEYLDATFDPEKSSHIKLLYIEQIKKPHKFYKHAKSLIQKGCKIAAIKSGGSEAGSRAASSHTGAMASSDKIIRAFFRKIGIVYCSGRQELITAGSIFSYKELSGKNIAIITHAGGSAVMLSDALSNGGLQVPEISGQAAQDLLEYLSPGSSVANPIDFLATGTADQLGIIIDYCEHKFDNIDAIIVVFGSPGLFDVSNVYKVLNVKMDVCKKPIYPVLPSIINAHKEIEYFLSKGRINFPDEVELGEALATIYRSQKNNKETPHYISIDPEPLQTLLANESTGYLKPAVAHQLLQQAQIPVVPEVVANKLEAAQEAARYLGFPLVMKVVGPVHKTEVKGVVLNINNSMGLQHEFERLMQIEGSTGVLLQPMLKGIELFIGAVKEPDYGHLVMCGIGGIFIEAIQDVSTAFSRISENEALQMINDLKGKALFEGIRGQNPISKTVFAELILRVSALVEAVPQIVELDLNPLIATEKGEIIAVDVRIRVA